MATNNNREKEFQSFINELEKLSKKYGVAIHSTGGVMIGDIESIMYSDDHTSGDLECKVVWK